MHSIPHGVMFHHFHSPDHHRAQGSISAGDLVAIIEHIGRSRILPAQEWMDRALSGSLRETDLCLTFDDTLLCQYDIAYPVLKRLGITAFWFTNSSVLEGNIERMEIYRKFRCTHFEDIDEFYRAFFQSLTESEFGQSANEALAGFGASSYLANFRFYSAEDRRFRYARDRVLGIERYNEIVDAMIQASGQDWEQLSRGIWMDDDCVRQIHADGHLIGLHTHTHPTLLESLGDEAQRIEYHTNREYLTRLLGSPPRTMAHPANSYNEQTLRTLEHLGIELGFRADMTWPVASHLEHPRQDHANLMQEIRQ